MLWVAINLAFQMFVFPLPAPAGAAFIAGLRRAACLVAHRPDPRRDLGDLLRDRPPRRSPRPDPDEPRRWIVQALALQGFLVAPIGAALFASAAAWYRRFLNLANPNRAQRVGAGNAAGPRRIKRDRLSH